MTKTPIIAAVLHKPKPVRNPNYEKELEEYNRAVELDEEYGFEVDPPEEFHIPLSRGSVVFLHGNRLRDLIEWSLQDEVYTIDRNSDRDRIVSDKTSVFRMTQQRADGSEYETIITDLKEGEVEVYEGEVGDWETYEKFRLDRPLKIR